jgi:hypothetical protein
MRSQPAALSAATWTAVSWSSVEALAQPIFIA